jgi:carbon-monoxide dehydrogenase large subunit
MLAAGQVHGGVATGIAQALYEEVRYDESGNPQTTSLAEYCIQSASELIMSDTSQTVTPTPLTPSARRA